MDQISNNTGELIGMSAEWMDDYIFLNACSVERTKLHLLNVKNISSHLLFVQL